uniref:Alcohol dehydrogenase-like C-terminal domain-containing protein n=1 Tax=Ciona savignyi TaxID=51511 RepID=H2YJ09_CIOSA
MADINEKSLKVAMERGADETVLWSRELGEEEAIEITKKAAIDGGFDGVIDIVNSKITAERAFKSTHRGSTLVMVGLYGGAASFSLPQFVHGLRQVRGVLTGKINQLRELVDLAAHAQFSAPPMTFFKLEDAFKAMCLIRDGKVQGRCIIKF